MKKDNKGITLIALVVTIIVLLILAGITIATLTDNQNGIFSNAKKARSNTVYSEADEKCRLALSAIQTEIAAGIAADSSYNATYKDNITTITSIIKKDCSGSEWTIINPTGNSDKSTTEAVSITIKYTNNALYAGSVTTGKPAKNGEINGNIIIEQQLASYDTLK